MKVFIGSDHRGFDRKAYLEKVLIDMGVEVKDCGAFAKLDGDDYPDFASEVARSVLKESASRGIVICGSGAGVDIVANKFKGIRSVVGISPEQVESARRDDDVNVLSLAADFISEEVSHRMVTVFLNTDFSSDDERFTRRLNKIKEIENG